MRIGHVHLKVADLDHAIAFYRDVLGLSVTADGREAGFDAAFLAAGAGPPSPEYTATRRDGSDRHRGARPGPEGRAGLLRGVEPDRLVDGDALMIVLWQT
jgi:catechol 2,3-dioxygenase